jgi:hypothetical protein
VHRPGLILNWTLEGAAAVGVAQRVGDLADERGDGLD